jgi:uncharacterized protein YodC (DUF2158 family)
MDQLTEWIEANHPLKIGEIVTSKEGGRKMIVTERELMDCGSGNIQYWTARGAILRKDGTPGVRIGTWSQKIDR